MESESVRDGFSEWAIVDLFGHVRVAGLVTEQTIGGCSFVRVDIPRRSGVTETRLYGQGAIYGITLVSEDVARMFGHRTPEPFGRYDLPIDVRRLAEAQEAEDLEGDEIPI